MNQRILIIDDEKAQVNNIKKAIEQHLTDVHIEVAYEEDDIKNKVRDLFFTIAIVDLRMDSFSINGFDIIRDIIEINPITRIIICSAYITEYSDELNEIIKSGKVAAILDKEKFDTFSSKIISSIESLVEEFDRDTDIGKKALLSLYSDAKNEDWSLFD